MKLKFYIYFLYSVFWINFSLSFLFAGLGNLAVLNKGTLMASFLSLFLALFATAGYASALLMVHFFNSKIRYMYYNVGISLTNLYLSGFIINLILVVLVQFII